MSWAPLEKGGLAEVGGCLLQSEGPFSPPLLVCDQAKQEIVALEYVSGEQRDAGSPGTSCPSKSKVKVVG